MHLNLSIIIPAYNEAKKIGADITACTDFIKKYGFSSEIIVVDDGSTDTTAMQAESAAVPADIDLKVITLKKHTGKGRAVKTGIIQSSGELVMFADSGLCIPLEYALKGIRQVQDNNCHIAVGSRKHPHSIVVQDQGIYRKLCSWLFYRMAIHKFPELNYLSDMQCGFKIYKGDIARELFKKSRINGFMFDIEILMMAIQKGYKICNFPVKWTCDLDSRLTPARHWMVVLQDLREIRKRIRPTQNKGHLP